MNTIEAQLHQTRKVNEANMDLFRVSVMIFVLGWHYVGYFHEKELSGWLFTFFYFLKHNFVIAVNCFVLMSGYFLYNNIFRISKAVLLLLKTTMYSVILYFIFSNLGYGDFSIPLLIKSFLPLRGWWFMFPYFIMYILSPYINTLCRDLSSKSFTNLMIMLFIIEVIWPSFVPASAIDVQGGYSLYNFLFLYITGVYFRRFSTAYKSWQILLVYMVVVTAGTSIHYLIQYPKVLPDIGKISVRFYNYNFLSVAIPAILFFLVFKKIKLNKPSLSFIRPHILAVYLIHKHVNVEAFWFRTVFHVGKVYSWPFLLLHMIAFITVTFILSILIDYLLSKIFEKPFLFIAEKTEKYLIKTFSSNTEN
jgi:hypothetical protein